MAHVSDHNQCMFQPHPKRLGPRAGRETMPFVFGRNHRQEFDATTLLDLFHDIIKQFLRIVTTDSDLAYKYSKQCSRFVKKK